MPGVRRRINRRSFSYSYEVMEDRAIFTVKHATHGLFKVVTDLDGLEMIIKDGRRLSVTKRDNSFYVRIGRAYLHRFLTNAPPGKEVDHRNHDTLDNRAANLRVCTGRENRQNRRGAQRNSRSGVRGVWFVASKNKWVVQVLHKSQGYYNTLEEAEAVAREVRARLMTHSNN
ncbi:HNH endonuclease [Paenibacillus sp. NPDC057967]|uniref:HNH endonuclease n=1 Tax=Paenibacillus sp. NPDC057967 TaxID=3346293 RepID=UPI0036DB861C